MNASIKIPSAVQIRIDDVGWFIGTDERHKGLPSRSGMTRPHTAEDYQVISDLGRALDMKITCSFVVGEWDRYNRLRGVPHVTWDEDGWDRASQIDMELAEQCRDIVNASDYIDVTIHGLMHGYYDNGKQVTEQQYYPRVYDAEKGCFTKQWKFLPDEEFRRHLELFHEIYNDWGFNKKVLSFAAPNGNCGLPHESTAYADILKEFGIYHWKNGWSFTQDTLFVISGVIAEKAIGIVPWNAYDIDPLILAPVITEDSVKPRVDLCLHWPNLLRYNPARNAEVIPAWVEYFRRQSEVFGAMISKNTGFSASQAMYSHFGELEITDGKCIVDLKNVDAKGAIALKNEFYVSMKNGTEPKACEGGSIELYETKQNFRTYKITRENTDKLIITL